MEHQAKITDAPVGTVLEGVYRIDRRIGEGGMGTVYEARQLRLDRRVAIKLLSRELAGNPDALVRFRREVEVTSQLGHPHIVHIIDVGTTSLSQPYLVMEYLDGEDLDARILRQTRLPLDNALHVTRQVASALSATHSKGIVHRDLKPANIFLVQVPGELDFVKVVDFGISKMRAARTKLTHATTLLGTPAYMAPEQVAGLLDEIDHRTDQWALACVTWEMLAGRCPFAADDVAALFYQVTNLEPQPLSSLAPGLPAGVEAALRRALSKRPADRFPSIQDFYRALEIAAFGDAESEKTPPLRVEIQNLTRLAATSMVVSLPAPSGVPAIPASELVTPGLGPVIPGSESGAPVLPLVAPVCDPGAPMEDSAAQLHEPATPLPREPVLKLVQRKRPLHEPVTSLREPEGPLHDAVTPQVLVLEAKDAAEPAHEPITKKTLAYGERARSPRPTPQAEPVVSPPVVDPARITAETTDDMLEPLPVHRRRYLAMAGLSACVFVTVLGIIYVRKHSAAPPPLPRAPLVKPVAEPTVPQEDGEPAADSERTASGQEPTMLEHARASAPARNQSARSSQSRRAGLHQRDPGAIQAENAAAAMGSAETDRRDLDEFFRQRQAIQSAAQAKQSAGSPAAPRSADDSDQADMDRFFRDHEARRRQSNKTAPTRPETNKPARLPNPFD